MPKSPSAENYVLGRGRIYFDRFDASGNKQGWIDLGNAPDFSVNISKETLPHYSSRTGIRVKDLEVVRELASSFQFTLDEFSVLNLGLAFMGEQASQDQSAGSVTSESITARHDKWVDVSKRKVSSVVVTDDPMSTTYVENTDYVVDYDEGMIKALSTGSITDGEALLVDFDYADLTQTVVKAMKDSKVDGALKFVGDPGAGPAVVIELHKSKLMPSGEIGFIGEEWANFQLQAEVVKDETGHPDSPYFDVIHVDAGWS
jgi:hypothetical protein